MGFACSVAQSLPMHACQVGMGASVLWCSETRDVAGLSAVVVDEVELASLVRRLAAELCKPLHMCVELKYSPSLNKQLCHCISEFMSSCLLCRWGHGYVSA